MTKIPDKELEERLVLKIKANPDEKVLHHKIETFLDISRQFQTFLEKWKISRQFQTRENPL